MKQVMTLLLLLVVSMTALHAQTVTHTRKVLIIGIDGTRPDALQKAKTPHIDGLLASSLYTFNGWHCGITMSGPSWSDILCGVWEAKHGVTGNSYSGSNFNRYPYFTKRAKEIIPDLYCAQVVEWAALNDEVYNDGWDEKIKVPDGNGGPTADSAVAKLKNPDMDCLFVYFDEVDLTGHSSGFNPANPLYISAIEKVDTHIGEILNTLYTRPKYSEENWLIFLVTDHGGTGPAHGGGTDAERQVWWIASGSAVPHKQMAGEDPGSYQYTGFPYFIKKVDPVKLKKNPVHTDIAVTALHHLLYETGINPVNHHDWALDGKSWIPDVTGVTNAGYRQPDIQLYPNPTDGLLTAWFENPFDEKADCSVTDMAGRQVETNIILQTKNKVTLELKNKVFGTYLINIRMKNSSMVRKFIVQ